MREAPPALLSHSGSEEKGKCPAEGERRRAALPVGAASHPIAVFWAPESSCVPWAQTGSEVPCTPDGSCLSAAFNAVNAELNE